MLSILQIAANAVFCSLLIQYHYNPIIIIKNILDPMYLFRLYCHSLTSFAILENSVSLNTSMLLDTESLKIVYFRRMSEDYLFFVNFITLKNTLFLPYIIISLVDNILIMWDIIMFVVRYKIQTFP